MSIQNGGDGEGSNGGEAKATASSLSSSSNRRRRRRSAAPGVTTGAQTDREPPQQQQQPEPEPAPKANPRLQTQPQPQPQTQQKAKPQPKQKSKPKPKSKPKVPALPTVVPRILMRPSPAPSAPATPSAPAAPASPAKPASPATPLSPREPHVQPHPLSPTPLASAPSSSSHSLLAIRIATATANRRPAALPLLSATGKLLAATRRAPASAASGAGGDPCVLRSTVGLIGRAGVGKTFLASRLFGHTGKALQLPQQQQSPGALDLCVLPGGTAYIDMPAVMSLGAADRWTKRSAGTAAARRSAARLRDLQLAVLALLVCDHVVVVVPPGDRSMGRLVGRAAELKGAIPGVAGGRPCAVHLVVNRSSASADAAAAAEAFAAAGVPLAGVSVLPEYSKKSCSSSLGAAEIAQRWAQEPALPLFSMLPGAEGSEHSLVAGCCCPTDVLSFDERMDMLREQVLGYPGRTESVSGWLAMCVRAWESIRRSDVLARAAATKDDLLDTMDA